VNASEILGAVGAASLRDRLTNLSEADGTARFMLDRLTGGQVAAIVRALLNDTATAAKIRIAVPRALVDGFELPSHVITDERTVALRHAEGDRPALLLANTDDDQGASLQDVTLMGAKQLSEEPQLWVQAASAGLGLPDTQLAVWEAALRGLAATEDWTLHQISNYVEVTRKAVAENSKPLLDALAHEAEPRFAKSDACRIVEQPYCLGSIGQCLKLRAPRVILRQHQLLSMQDRWIKRIPVVPVADATSD
jgi:DNA segregation ATPase FtsK/SpoIIIE, S-DNA-T family